MCSHEIVIIAHHHVIHHCRKDACQACKVLGWTIAQTLLSLAESNASTGPLLGGYAYLLLTTKLRHSHDESAVCSWQELAYATPADAPGLQDCSSGKSMQLHRRRQQLRLSALLDASTLCITCRHALHSAHLPVSCQSLSFEQRDLDEL